MHTDEYEISINRELNHCLHVVNKTRTDLEQRTQQYGMCYEQAVIAFGESVADFGQGIGQVAG